MASSKIRKDAAIAVGVLGIIQTLIGFGICICCFVFAGKQSDVITPFWSGIPLLLSGLTGIVIAITKSQCLLTVYLIANIVLCLIMLVSAVLTGIGYALFKLATHYLETLGCKNFGKSCVCTTDHDLKIYHDMECDKLKTVVSLLQALAALSALGAISCLVASICSCMGLCCCKPEPQNTVVVTQGQPIVIHQQTGNPEGIIMYQPPPWQAPPPDQPLMHTGDDTKPAFIHTE